MKTDELLTEISRMTDEKAILQLVQLEAAREAYPNPPDSVVDLKDTPQANSIFQFALSTKKYALALYVVDSNSEVISSLQNDDTLDRLLLHTHEHGNDSSGARSILTAGLQIKNMSINDFQAFLSTTSKRTKEENAKKLLDALKTDDAKMLSSLLDNVDITAKQISLYAAATGGKINSLNILLKDPSIDTYEQQKALILASREGVAETVKILLQAGSKPDSAGLENIGCSPLEMATKFRHKNICEILLTYNANSQNSEPLDQSVMDRALEFAVDASDKEICVLLLNHHANPTPALYAAAGKNNIQLCELLLKHGADVNVERLGGTPLHYAARKGDVEAATWLLEHKAAPSRMDAYWKTPLMLAAKYGHNKFCEILLSLLSRKITQLEKDTALFYAKQYNKQDVDLYLQQNGAKYTVTEDPYKAHMKNGFIVPPTDADQLTYVYIDSEKLAAVCRLLKDIKDHNPTFDDQALKQRIVKLEDIVIEHLKSTGKVRVMSTKFEAEDLPCIHDMFTKATADFEAEQAAVHVDVIGGDGGAVSGLN